MIQSNVTSFRYHRVFMEIVTILMGETFAVSKYYKICGDKLSRFSFFFVNSTGVKSTLLILSN